MSACHSLERGDLELHFYGELDEASDARVVAHLRACESCRSELAELRAISSALAAAAPIDAPPGGDWTRLMARIDVRTSGAGRGFGRTRPRANLTTWAIAAMVALVAIGGYMAADLGVLQRHRDALARSTPASRTTVAPSPAGTALREIAAEHIERSKVVVLGLAMRDARRATPGDWEYERRLAGSLLSDTRLYRMAAQDKGMNDVAHVLRDLETVLLEASLSDHTDRGALERVQRLISKRDLVVEMQVVAGSAGI